MKVLITGICGFAGSELALGLRDASSDLEIFGFDNFIRPGSETNRERLRQAGIAVRHGDVRLADDVAHQPAADWVIDAAANPSVLAGTPGHQTSSRDVLQHNLVGTMHVLEYCRAHGAGCVLLSTSRVYSMTGLRQLALDVRGDRFVPRAAQSWPDGCSPAGLTEAFSTTPPLSLYGISKLCSESLALEYGAGFGFPVWINRLGVLAGAGQFGRADQGIFSFWIHACAARRPLKFIGFGGHGWQVRDCLHPRDLIAPLLRQMRSSPSPQTAVTNFSGGLAGSLSLRQLHTWCEDRFGPHPVESSTEDRAYDAPWIVLDSAAARVRFDWTPSLAPGEILEQIARHAEAHRDWLDRT